MVICDEKSVEGNYLLTFLITRCSKGGSILVKNNSRPHGRDNLLTNNTHVFFLLGKTPNVPCHYVGTYSFLSISQYEIMYELGKHVIGSLIRILTRRV